MSAIAWASIKVAIHAWVVATSGLAAGQVFWAFPGKDGKAAPRPNPPCIEMHLDFIRPVGSDWKVTRDAAVPEPGAELEVVARGMRTARLELQCYGLEGSGTSAMETLTEVMSGLPLFYYDLDRAGAGIGHTDDVQLLELRRGGILEPRAITSLRLHLASEVIGTQTYVERMQVTTTARSASGDVVAESEQWIPDPPVET